MELTLNVWLAFGTGVVLGGLIIFFLRRRVAGADRERSEQLASELEETREELDVHRDEVAKHFHDTSQLFRNLTEQYTRLYAHLAEGAREFCTDDEPALARGFDGPLLGRNGDDAGHEPEAAAETEAEAEAETHGVAGREATPPEPRPDQANGGSSPQQAA